MEIKQTAIILFYIMFLYSGINKINTFDKKVDVLMEKIGLSKAICILGMIGVILLEIFGSIILIIDAFDDKIIPKKIIKLVQFTFLLFMVVVTIIYHPPSMKKMIPFLSNLTTFSGMLYMYSESISSSL